jgi:hypothetical protein
MIGFLWLVSDLQGIVDPSHTEAIQSILSRYQRTFTLLEIGTDVRYLAALPYQKHMVGEVIALGQEEHTILRTVLPRYPSSISVMIPPVLTYRMLETLSRCEHFDVVIAHDLSSYGDIPSKKLIAVLVSLGEHVFMIPSSESHQEAMQGYTCMVHGLPERQALYLSVRPKKGFDLARYTQYKAPASMPRYLVSSSYTHKEFYKDGLMYPVPWIHGINLVTFCMFHGIHPDDEELRRQLVRCRERCQDHNDLVIGNFILQGCRLFPIDSKDDRRCADPYRFINVLLNAFKRNNRRLINPQEWIDTYYHQLV